MSPVVSGICMVYSRWSCLERLTTCGLAGGGTSLGAGIEFSKPTIPRSPSVACWRFEGWATRFQLPAPAALSVTCCPGRTLTSWNHKPHINCLFYKGCLAHGVLSRRYKGTYRNLQATLLSSSLFLLGISSCVFAAVYGIIWFGLNCKT